MAPALSGEPGFFCMIFVLAGSIDLRGLLGPAKVNSGRAEHPYMLCRGAMQRVPMNTSKN